MSDNQGDIPETSTNRTPSPSREKDKRKGKANNSLTFTEDEFQIYDEQSKILKHDNETYDDLKETPYNPPPIRGEKLDKLIEKNGKDITLMDRNTTPSINRTMDKNDTIGSLTLEEYREEKRKMVDRRKLLVMRLASKDYIYLDLKQGMKEGKAVFLRKPFWFNSISKQEEMQIKLKNARVSEISHRYSVLVNTPVAKWTDDDKVFVPLAQAMIEIAGYKVTEFEAFLRLGMEEEDYARVDTDQYKLAIEAIRERTENPSVSNPEE